MRAWLIVASWWVQGALDHLHRMHLTTDPACACHRAPKPGSLLDRASRGLECEPCMVRRALTHRSETHAVAVYRNCGHPVNGKGGNPDAHL